MEATKLSKEYLGLAAEYAVAAELCRRNVYAQLTLGTRKRTDLLVDTDTKMLRVQVKAKQGRAWPNCKGIYGQDSILIFVDYADKGEYDRPDFCILTSDEWRKVVIAQQGEKISEGKIILENNVPVWINQIKNGKPYKGIAVERNEVKDYLEDWPKVTEKAGIDRTG